MPATAGTDHLNESLQIVLDNNLSKRVNRRITPIRKNRFSEFEQSVDNVVHLNSHATFSGEALVNQNAEMDRDDQSEMLGGPLP